MKDIKKAIEIEKEYVAHRLKGEYPYHLIDKIRECGFNTIDEYFESKKIFEFNQLNFEYQKTTPDKCLADVFVAMQEKRVAVLTAVSDKTFVFKGTSDKYFNEDYCVENGITIYELGTYGGTIVSTKGDLSLGICIPKGVGITTKYILDKIALILSGRIAHVEVARNDILVNGGKVLGSTSYTHDDMFMFVAHISFNDNSQLIANICQNPRAGTVSAEKKPSYINGMTSDEFIGEVAKWLKVNYI